MKINQNARLWAKEHNVQITFRDDIRRNKLRDSLDVFIKRQHYIADIAIKGVYFDKIEFSPAPREMIPVRFLVHDTILWFIYYYASQMDPRFPWDKDDDKDASGMYSLTARFLEAIGPEAASEFSNGLITFMEDEDDEGRESTESGGSVDLAIEI